MGDISPTHVGTKKATEELRRKLFALDIEIAMAQRDSQPPFVLATMHESFRNNAVLHRQLESKLLLEEAESWGIEIPVRDDWREIAYITGFGVDGIKVDDPLKERAVSVLSARGRTMITKQIREARLAYWKSWAEILIPILSLVVAIIALLKT